MPVSLRDFQAGTDLDQLLVWYNAYESEPVTAEQVLRWYSDTPEGRIFRRRVAVGEQGELVGYSLLEHQTWDAAGLFYVWIIVEPAWRCQGIGDRLYQDAARLARERGAVRLKSDVREGDQVSLDFAARRGFEITRRQFESVLDLETFDETPYLVHLARLEAEGISFFPLSAYPDYELGCRKLYEVNYETALDTPGIENSWMPLEEFLQYVCKADWFNPEGQWIAAAGDEWIGLGAIRLIPEEQSAYNLMTGVRRPYTGRKVAQALKIHGIRYARAHGAHTMRTHNASTNAPMLAINRKLGYIARLGKVYLQVHLD
jgi:GNAT superfamily N-acetyltransferase